MPARVDDRGRVLIPKELREQAGLGPGSLVLIDVDEDGVHLRPARARSEALERLIGVITEENADPGAEPLDPLDLKKLWEPDV